MPVVPVCPPDRSSMSPKKRTTLSHNSKKSISSTPSSSSSRRRNGTDRTVQERLILWLPLFFLTVGTIFLLSLFRQSTPQPPHPLPLPPSVVIVSTMSSEGVHMNNKDPVPMASSPSSPSSSATITLPLKLVSMNIAECVPAVVAPSSWDAMQSAEAIRKEVLQSDPDVIALQEVPRGFDTTIFLEQNFGGPYGYTVIGTSPSHAGKVALLVRTALLAPLPPSSDDSSSAVNAAEIPVLYKNGSSLPAVMAHFEWTDKDVHSHGILVTSCHLAPFQSGSGQRRRQMELILQTAEDYYSASSQQQQQSQQQQRPVLIIAGDTNMRDTEDKTMEKKLHLLDAWKVAGSDPATKFSWDTVDHTRESNNNGSFNEYYGDGTRQYQTRYDRIYILPPQPSQTNSQTTTTTTTTTNIRVPHFQLIANHPLLNSKNHFLSDHFGVAAQLDIVFETTKNTGSNNKTITTWPHRLL